MTARSPNLSTKPPRKGDRQALIMYGMLITWLALEMPALRSSQYCSTHGSLLSVQSTLWLESVVGSGGA